MVLVELSVLIWILWFAWNGGRRCRFSALQYAYGFYVIGPVELCQIICVIGLNPVQRMYFVYWMNRKHGRA